MAKRGVQRWERTVDWIFSPGPVLTAFAALGAGFCILLWTMIDKIDRNEERAMDRFSKSQQSLAELQGEMKWAKSDITRLLVKNKMASSQTTSAVAWSPTPNLTGVQVVKDQRAAEFVWRLTMTIPELKDVLATAGTVTKPELIPAAAFQVVPEWKGKYYSNVRGSIAIFDADKTNAIAVIPEETVRKTLMSLP